MSLGDPPQWGGHAPDLVRDNAAMHDALAKSGREIAALRAEVERLNKMRVHCERCGADYLATGIEAGCPCKLVAEVERLTRENSVAAMLLREYEADAHAEDVGNVTRWLAAHDARLSGQQNEGRP